MKLPLSEDKATRAEEMRLFNEYLRITYGSNKEQKHDKEEKEEQNEPEQKV